MPTLSKMLPSFSFSNFENFRELPSKISLKYIALILNFKTHPQKILGYINCPHSHSRNSRIFENYPYTLENSHVLLDSLLAWVHLHPQFLRKSCKCIGFAPHWSSCLIKDKVQSRTFYLFQNMIGTCPHMFRCP